MSVCDWTCILIINRKISSNKIWQKVKKKEKIKNNTIKKKMLSHGFEVFSFDGINEMIITTL